MPIWTVEFKGPEDEMEKYHRCSAGYVTVDGDTEDEAHSAAMKLIAHPALCSPGGNITNVELAGPVQVAVYEQRRGR
jgi:hypothetical protein